MALHIDRIANTGAVILDYDRLEDFYSAEVGRTVVYKDSTGKPYIGLVTDKYQGKVYVEPQPADAETFTITYSAGSPFDGTGHYGVRVVTIDPEALHAYCLENFDTYTCHRRVVLAKLMG